MSGREDGDPEANFRSSFAVGRGLPGRVSLNPPPPGRLSSLRSRDLTLGGFKKKTFVPNVHSVRKTKDELQEETHTAPKKERRDREDRHRERRRREKPQTIQSHSIFEQGPADSYRKMGNWRGSNLSDCDPALITKSIKKEKINTQDDDQEILQKLQRDDLTGLTHPGKQSKNKIFKINEKVPLTDDMELKRSITSRNKSFQTSRQLMLFLDDPGLKNDPMQRPIRLPLHQACNFLSTEAANTFKEETKSDAVKSSRGASVSPQQPTVGELFEQLSVSEREELLFIQLPDAIPGQPKSISPEKKRKDDVKPADKHSPHVKAQDQTDKTTPPVLSDFSEGLIGKLQIRRSGKVQMLIGNVTLDVSEGSAFSFLQQLVCVRLSDGLTGDMSVLGNVKHKLVCSPDFHTLLQEVKLPPDS